MKTLIGEVKNFGPWFFIRNLRLPRALFRKKGKGEIAEGAVDADAKPKRRFSLPKPQNPAAAFKATGMGWIHRLAARGGNASYLAWVERDVARHAVINSAGDLLVQRRVRHSKMREKYPDQDHCYYPSDTASIRRVWLLGAPAMLAFFVGGTWGMLCIGYSIALGWTMSYFLWALPPIAGMSLLFLPFGNWLGYRFAPKPLWIYRLNPSGEILPLVYEQEAFEGSFSPAYIKSLSAATDYREFGEGEKTGGANVLRAGAFIAGIVGVCAIIWLAFSNDPSGAPPPPPIIEATATPEVDWQ